MTTTTFPEHWVASTEWPARISAFMNFWKRRKRKPPVGEPAMEDVTLVPGF